jgi:hypothetical protein
MWLALALIFVAPSQLEEVDLALLARRVEALLVHAEIVAGYSVKTETSSGNVFEDGVVRLTQNSVYKVTTRSTFPNAYGPHTYPFDIAWHDSESTTIAQALSGSPSGGAIVRESVTRPDPYAPFRTISPFSVYSVDGISLVEFLQTCEDQRGSVVHNSTWGRLATIRSDRGEMKLRVTLALDRSYMIKDLEVRRDGEMIFGHKTLECEIVDDAWWPRRVTWYFGSNATQTATFVYRGMSVISPVNIAYAPGSKRYNTITGTEHTLGTDGKWLLTGRTTLAPVDLLRAWLTVLAGAFVCYLVVRKVGRLE